MTLPDSTSKNPAFHTFGEILPSSVPETATKRWSLTAQIFHWVSAALVFSLFALGMYAAFVLDFQNPAELPLWATLMYHHKTLGMILLLVMPARLGWALAHKRPPLPEGLGSGQRVLLKSGHRTLYTLLFAVPLTGLFTAFYFGSDNRVFGLFSFPSPLAKNDYLWPKFMLAHQILAYSMLALVAGHIAAALWHHFVRRDGMLKAMVPGTEETK
jgi:cytochrome b561